jgi:hypothetical protein
MDPSRRYLRHSSRIATDEAYLPWKARDELPEASRGTSLNEIQLGGVQRLEQNGYWVGGATDVQERPALICEEQAQEVRVEVRIDHTERLNEADLGLSQPFQATTLEMLAGGVGEAP